MWRYGAVALISPFVAHKLLQYHLEFGLQWKRLGHGIDTREYGATHSLVCMVFTA